MADWLISQLVSSPYFVPYSLARTWVEGEMLTLCLDGLEEITVSGSGPDSDQNEDARRLLNDTRRDCIQALNDHIEETEIQLALCCRVDEYTSLGIKLRTRRGDGANITIARLSDEQVRAYMEKSKDELKSLREAMDRDSTLQEMARTPFLLTAMAISYREDQGVSTASIFAGGVGGFESRLTHLFNKYLHVHYRIAAEPLKKRYTLDQLRHYLAVLAYGMEKDSTNFFVEHLQPDWLPPNRRWQHIGLVSLFLFIFIGVVVAFPSGFAIGYEWTDSSKNLAEGLRRGVAGALGVMLLCGGFVAGGYAVTRRWGFGIACGLGLGIARGVIAGISPNEGHWGGGVRVFLVTWVVGTVVLIPVMKHRNHARDKIQPLESQKWDTRKALLGLLAASLIGLVFWKAFGSARGLGFGVALMSILALAFGQLGTNFDLKTYPNQGIWESAYAARRIALFGAISGVILFGTIYWLAIGLEQGWVEGRRQGIVNAILGLTLAIASLVFGVVPVMQHLSLRCLLTLHGQVPRSLVGFLNTAADLFVLRRVGGGYTFQHSFLRDYFYTLHQENSKARGRRIQRVPD
jgi:hypothetical protein